MEIEEARKLSWFARPAAQTVDTEERFLMLASTGLDRAYRLAGLILGNASDAEDATQDAMESAWKARHTLKDAAAFQGWFDRVLVNTCRDRLRRHKRIGFVSLDPDGDDRASPDPFARVLDQDHVLRALGVLTPEQRAVVALHYWSDLPLTEVAQRLDCPVGTVKTRLHAALERMRSCMHEDLQANRKAGRE